MGFHQAAQRFQKGSNLKGQCIKRYHQKIAEEIIQQKKTYYVYIVAKKKVGKRTYKTGVNYVSPIEKGKYQSGLYYK